MGDEAKPTAAELAVMSKKGGWLLALAATNAVLTDLLISHIAEEGELVGWELLEDMANWYMDAALMGVDLTHVNSYLESFVAERMDDEPEVVSFLGDSFLGPIRLALDDPARREAGRAAVAALGPLMQERARETQGIIHADPK